MRAPIERAIALSPRDRNVGIWYHGLGLHWFWQGQDDEAIPYFVRACDLAPALIYPVSFLSSALAHAGRRGEAERTLSSWCEAIQITDYSIATLRSRMDSDNGTYLAGHERLYAGLRLIGVPEV